jgi:hypothetical protein
MSYRNAGHVGCEFVNISPSGLCRAVLRRLVGVLTFDHARHSPPDDPPARHRCEILRRGGVRVVAAESLLLKHQFVRIIGFGVEPAYIDRWHSVCRMFSCATASQAKPKRLSTDHDPLFRFHRWLANLRVLRLMRSSQFHTSQFRIRSSSGSSVQSATSVWIAHSFGMPWTWRESWRS